MAPSGRGGLETVACASAFCRWAVVLSSAGSAKMMPAPLGAALRSQRNVCRRQLSQPASRRRRLTKMDAGKSIDLPASILGSQSLGTSVRHCQRSLLGKARLSFSGFSLSCGTQRRWHHLCASGRTQHDCPSTKSAGTGNRLQASPPRRCHAPLYGSDRRRSIRRFFYGGFPAGGTSKAGLASKKPTGLSMKPE